MAATSGVWSDIASGTGDRMSSGPWSAGALLTSAMVARPQRLGAAPASGEWMMSVSFPGRPDAAEQVERDG
jgi:hypothetical protein